MSKKLFPILIVVLIALGGLYYFNRYVAAPSIKLGELKLYGTDGLHFDINSLKGKKTVIFMYASWCGQCRQELEAVSTIRDTQLGDVEIVCISDEPMEKVVAFKENKNYPYTFLKMEQGFNDIGIYSIPVTYFVNGNLQVVEEKLGYIPWNDEATVIHLKSLLRN
ncbi:MAG: TlpA family protein disulfide reductase [Bacteroidia bacterium]